MHEIVVTLSRSLHQIRWCGGGATSSSQGERGGSVVECRTPEREVRGSRPTSAVLCPWARHFTPRKYWLITQEAMAPSRHDWKIVDWDVKPQHNQPTNSSSHTNPPILTHTLQYQTEWSLIICLAGTNSDWSVPGDEMLHPGDAFKCTIPRSGSHWRPSYDWNNVATTQYTATFWTVDWQLRVCTEANYNYILMRDNQC